MIQVRQPEIKPDDISKINNLIVFAKNIGVGAELEFRISQDGVIPDQINSWLDEKSSPTSLREIFRPDSDETDIKISKWKMEKYQDSRVYLTRSSGRKYYRKINQGGYICKSEISRENILDGWGTLVLSSELPVKYTVDDPNHEVTTRTRWSHDHPTYPVKIDITKISGESEKDTPSNIMVEVEVTDLTNIQPEHLLGVCRDTVIKVTGLGLYVPKHVRSVINHLAKSLEIRLNKPVTLSWTDFYSILTYETKTRQPKFVVTPKVDGERRIICISSRYIFSRHYYHTKTCLDEILADLRTTDHPDRYDSTIIDSELGPDGVYYLIDIIQIFGQDVTRKPLRDRQRLLERILGELGGISTKTLALKKYHDVSEMIDPNKIDPNKIYPKLLSPDHDPVKLDGIILTGCENYHDKIYKWKTDQATVDLEVDQRKILVQGDKSPLENYIWTDPNKVYHGPGIYEFGLDQDISKKLLGEMGRETCRSINQKVLPQVCEKSPDQILESTLVMIRPRHDRIRGNRPYVITKNLEMMASPFNPQINPDDFWSARCVELALSKSDTNVLFYDEPVTGFMNVVRCRYTCKSDLDLTGIVLESEPDLETWSQLLSRSTHRCTYIRIFHQRYLSSYLKSWNKLGLTRRYSKHIYPKSDKILVELARTGITWVKTRFTKIPWVMTNLDEIGYTIILDKTTGEPLKIVRIPQSSHTSQKYIFVDGQDPTCYIYKVNGREIFDKDSPEVTLAEFRMNCLI